MTKQRIVSGMRSTGKLHLGHYIGVLQNWVKLQDDYECFFFIADWHALTTKFDDTDSLKQNIRDITMDWLACGLDPEKSTIYLQSLVPETAELHIYLSMITPQNWVERDPTLKDMAKILRSNENEAPSVSYGLLGYPVLMSADIMMFNADYIPVGSDQIAHIEITRDIANRFNRIYKTDFFKEPKPKLTEVPLLKGIDGQKMGKSFHNDIKLSDTEEDTTKKIKQAITDRNRIRKTDPGNPDNCEVVFPYYEIFAEYDQITKTCEECQAATRGCADCKIKLAEIVNDYLRPMREKRHELEKNPGYVDDVIREGSKKARIVAPRQSASFLPLRILPSASHVSRCGRIPWKATPWTTRLWRAEKSHIRKIPAPDRRQAPCNLLQEQFSFLPAAADLAQPVVKRRQKGLIHCPRVLGTDRDAAHTGDTDPLVHLVRVFQVDGLDRAFAGAEAAACAVLVRLRHCTGAAPFFVRAVSGNIRLLHVALFQFALDFAGKFRQLPFILTVRPPCGNLPDDGVLRHGGDGGNHLKSRFFRGVRQFRQRILIGTVAVHTDQNRFRAISL